MTDIESPEPTVELTPDRTLDQDSAQQPEEQERPEQPEQPEQPSTAPAKPRRTGLKAVAAVAAAALLGVGIGELIIKVHYQDAPAPAAVAAGPAPAPSPSATWGAKSTGNHFGSLRDLLLPVPTGYRLGPDHGSFGNDSELRREDLDKAEKDMLTEVPEKYRQNAENMLASLHLQGIGSRTVVSGDDRIVVTMVLRQFNQQWVAAQNSAYGDWYTDNELYRQGPGVSGHPEARCALPALKAGDQLDFVECYAGVGDLLVEMEVSGVAPLDQNKVVDLFRQQLDRLAIPGASV
ncbi:haloacid dehalogenase-like hydrolase [Streptomyces sp. TLI_171]|uniref:haloacid dehalogenase-like hydrolase n=1 Tax=Streptomyces sp. TLI_171 TaxID=1938859 RepID=UPI000C17A3CA|nr:haloacid dehalogenase-like hydrolase [Streptomyces sp. TLI_171]RKE20405.1 hypothetical protein BX266_3762 [Streptomyces sp. TLI_171]